MKQIIKVNIKYWIFLFIFGLVGGYFTSLYSIQSLNQDMLDEVIVQVGSLDVIVIVTTIQSLGYALILGVIGKILAKKIGLWRSLKFSKKAMIEIIIVTIFGGILLIVPDYLFFGKFSEAIMDSYSAKPSIEYIIASITYGGVIEEVMLRLFLMSLIAVIIQKISKQEEMNEKILVIANIIAALLFAAGHLPATIIMISPVTPMIIFRCFLFNGGFGLLFGRLYRKYGIYSAMLGHAGVHIVSKLIWVIFI